MDNSVSREGPPVHRRDQFPAGVAVVIGGSGGIGSAICLALAEAGTDVVLTYRTSRAAADAVVAGVGAHGRQAHSYALSVEQAADVDQFFAQVVGVHGRIHSVINASGAHIPMVFIGDLTREEWLAAMNSDANGFFNVMHASLPHLRALGGSYVQIGTVGMHRWPARDVLSVAPKAAIDALITGIAREEGRSGVRANTVALGLINAGLALRLKGSGYDDKYFEAAVKNTALKRLGTAAEVADAVVFLASERAAYVTGQTLVLDGGFSL